MPVSRSLLTNPVALQSSSLAQVAYDGRQSVLQVRFRDGTAYQYTGVPLAIYQGLLEAASKGAYFNHHVRNVYPHALLHPARPSGSLG
jgi:hypothetical protein